jgi:RNA polymerase sigma factor (sigma-70 family)
MSPSISTVSPASPITPASSLEEKIKSVFPFIRGYANKFVRSAGVERSDLEQEGVIGILESSPETWNPEQGSFLTYVAPWIKRNIRNYVARHNLVKISDNRINLIKKFIKVQEYLTASNRPAGVRETLEEMGIDINTKHGRKLRDCCLKGMEALHMTSESFGEDVGGIDFESGANGPVDCLYFQELYFDKKGFLGDLDKRTIHILKEWKGGDGKKQGVIAKEINLSDARVSQLIQEAKEHITNKLYNPAPGSKA